MNQEQFWFSWIIVAILPAFTMIAFRGWLIPALAWAVGWTVIGWWNNKELFEEEAEKK